MLSLRRRSPAVRRRRDTLWPLLAATTLTWVSFAVVFFSLRLRVATSGDAGVRDRALDSERLVYVAPRETPPPLLPLPLRRMARAVARSPAPLSSTARDTGSAHTPRTEPTAVAATAPSSSSSVTAPAAPSARLMPSRAVGAEWYVRTLPRDPFVPAAPLSGERRDSTLSALGTSVPALAARRVQTESERDAGAKEAMLKIRMSGRALIVPPDNTGGLITHSLPWPLGDRGKAKRERDSKVFEETRARYARLRQRADSLRRARGDTLPPE